MGVLTLIIDQNAAEHRHLIRLPNGIPCYRNRISLVGWALHKNPTLAGTNAKKILKVRIPWLASASSLITGKEDAIDTSKAIVLTLDGSTFYEAYNDVALHFDVTEEIIPPAFYVEILNEDNSPNDTMIYKLVLTFQFETRRLL